MNTLSHAIRLAYRRLTGRKLVSAVIVLCLALGIGANTAIFSVINRLLLQPLPLEEVERVVFTLTMRTEDDPFEASLLDATAFRTQAHSFSDVGLGRYETFTVYGLERPERLAGASISYDYLTTLRVKAALGRAFQPEDDRPGAAPVAMLSQSAWKSRFGGDPSIVGRSLNLDNRHYTVVGILPEGFDLPLRTQVWVPLATDIETAPLKERTAHKYFLVARLRPGVTLEQANDEARGIARGIAEAHPEHRKGWGIKLIPLRQQLLGDITGNIRPTLLVLMGIVGFLLLITCANVASLLLVRSLERMHETAVQLALGASHRRLVLQLMTESVMLSLAGGAAGLLLAFVVTKLLMTLRPIQFFAMGEAFQSVQMDGSVLLFAFAVSLLTGIVFGLAPALWTSSAGGLNHFLKEGGQRGGVGRRGRRLFEALMVAEVAVATLLLFGAGLMVKSFQRLSDAKLGFRPDNLMAMEMHLSESDYPQHAQRQQFTGRVLERVRSMPGVSAAGMTTNIPVSVSSRDSKYTVEGQQGRDASESPITSHRLVTAGYLETLGVTLLRGRLIEEQDQANTQPVVVVSKEFAGREWPGQEALGKRVKPGNPAAPTTPWYTVVGVVDDVKEDRFNFRNDRPVWYLPYAQVENRLPVTLLLRSAGDPSALAASVRAEIGAMNPNQPVTEVGTLEGQLADFLGPQRFTALLSSLFAVVGLFLAVVGIYGVTAYSVIQRTREFSVRIAFGAGWRDLVRLVVGRGLRLAVVGLVLGSLGGLALGRLLSSLLYQVRPTAPEIIILPASILLFVVLLAIYLPLRKVARLNPVEGLRHE